MRKIDAAEQQADRRHQDVGDEGADDPAEGGADDDADRHVEDVAPHGKFLEFFQHSSFPLKRLTRQPPLPPWNHGGSERLKRRPGNRKRNARLRKNSQALRLRRSTWTRSEEHTAEIHSHMSN